MRSCERCHTPYKTRVEFCGLDGSPVIETDEDLLIGATFDRYRVVERLGGGGMAVVYRAVHDVIDREVAVKVLFGEMASDRTFAERFRREAQAASRIKHPNVVEIFDFGQTSDGMSFLIMEMLRGATLAEAIHLAGPFPPRRAAAVLRQIAAGLSAAHGMGFVHRDLKPGNVMLVDGLAQAGAPLEVAKILDFGLVLVRASDDQERRLTQTGQTMGTPYYMAPEQFQDGEATPLSDLYSLGAVLHEMLSGHAPFRGSLADVVVKQTSAAPPPLPKSGGLEKLARRLLEKNPKKRPQSAGEVIAAIDALGLGPVRPEDIRARPETLELDLADVVVAGAPELPPPDSDASLSSSPPRRGLVLAALTGALALSGGLWLVAAPRPAALAAVWPPAEAAATAPAPPRPTTDALEAAVKEALLRRGLTLDDAKELVSLEPLVLRWRAALAKGDHDEARALAEQLVPEIARARVDQRVLRAKLARLKARLAASSSSPKERAAMTARLQALEDDITPELSEAECSRLALQMGELERP